MKNKNGKIIFETFLMILLLFLVMTGFLSKASPDQNIDSCMVINIADTYNLTGDVSSSGNCFTINSANTILDCGGNQITFASVDGGEDNSGIIINNDNITLIDCELIQGSTVVPYVNGIWVKKGADNFNMTNHFGYFVFTNSSHSDAVHIDGNNPFLRLVVPQVTEPYSAALYLNGTIGGKIEITTATVESNNAYACLLDNVTDVGFWAGYCEMGTNVPFIEDSYGLLMKNSNNSYFNRTTFDLEGHSDIIRIQGSRNNIFDNVDIFNIGDYIEHAFYLENSDNNQIIGGEISTLITNDALESELYIDANSVENNISNVQFSSYAGYETNISINNYSGAVAINSSKPYGSMPINWKNLSKYISVEADNYAYLNIIYTHDELLASNINERSLEIWKYFGANWINTSFYDEYGINLNDNYAYANITSFSNFSLFGKLPFYYLYPHIDFISPTPSNDTSVPRTYVFINISSDLILYDAQLDWNGTNYTMNPYPNNLTWYLNKTSLADSLYVYKIYGQPAENLTNWNVSETRHVIVINDITPPNVILWLPVDNFNRSNISGGFTFACNNTDDVNLKNSTLYGNWSGWGAKETKEITGINNLSSFTYGANEISEGSYVWNCYTCDEVDNCAFATNNFTLNNDYTPPTVTLWNPAQGSIHSPGDITFQLKCADYETYPNYLSLYGNWSGWGAKATNSSPIQNEWWSTVQTINDEGIYTWSAWCNDTAGNEDYASGNKTFTILNDAISQCKNITSSGSYYLTDNLTTTGTCIYINVSDVILDCQDYYITGDGGALDIGIEVGAGVSSISNVTIKNCTIDKFGSGIKYTNGFLNEILDNVITNSTDYGIYISSSNTTNITNNNIENNDLIAGDCVTIKETNSILNTVDNLVCSDATYGVSIESALNNTVKNSVFYNTSNTIALSTTNYSIINNITTNISNDYSFYIFNSYFSEISNISIGDTNMAIRLTGSNLYDNSFIFNNLSSDLISFNHYNKVDVNKSTNNAIDPSGYKNIGKYIFIENQSADSWVNLSFYYEDSDWQNIGIENESSLTLLRYNFDSLVWEEVPGVVLDITENYVYANLSNFSFYNISGIFGSTTINVNDCRELNTTNTTYQLIQNVSSAGTCFTINATNITLDCNGYWVNYSNSETGYGIYGFSYDYPTIKNCNFLTGNSSILYNFGIYLDSFPNGIIFNNSFSITSNSTASIKLSSSQNLNISSNDITSGTDDSSEGILLDNSGPVNLTNNKINVSGLANGLVVFQSGLELFLDSNNFSSDLGYDYYAVTQSYHDAILTNLTLINQTNISQFTKINLSYYGKMKIDWSGSPASDPPNFFNISKYIYLNGQTGWSPSIPFYIFYEDSISGCTGSLDCSLGNDNYTKCALCGQCDDSGIACEDNPSLLCSILDETQCNNVPSACEWDGMICNPSGIGTCAGASMNDCELLEEYSAGCQTLGPCSNGLSGQCGNCATQILCETNCGDVGCGPWVDGRNESKFKILKYTNPIWTVFETSYGNITENWMFFNLKQIPNDDAYYTIMEDNRTGAESINAPENLSIFLREDNITTKINWSVVSGAEGYLLYYSDNLSLILNATSQFPHIPARILVGENNNTYNDTTANEDTRRFYRVASYINEGTVRNISNVNETVGKYTTTILSDGDYDEGTFSLPLNQSGNISDLIYNPSNAGSYVYTFSNETYSWKYNTWTGSYWDTTYGFEYINSSEGYWTFGFLSEENITNIGYVPVGDVNRTIYAGGSNGESTFGWESITTGENISYAIPNPSNAGSYVYTYMGDSFGGWKYNTWTGSYWDTTYGFETYEPTQGYWTFGFIENTSNLNYTRNPY